MGFCAIESDFGTEIDKHWYFWSRFRLLNDLTYCILLYICFVNAELSILITIKPFSVFLYLKHCAVLSYSLAPKPI